MKYSTKPWALFLIGAMTVVVACGGNTAQDSPQHQSHAGAVAKKGGVPDVILESAAVMGTPDRPIAGPQGGVGQFVVECELSHVAADDPILYPDQPGASHLHAFFGNTSTSAGSTLEELVSSPTSCDDPQDTAAYWVPVLIDDGQVIAPTSSVAYYRAGLGIEATTVQAYPPGLVMIAGDPMASEPQPLSVVAWSCGNGSQRSALPPECPRRVWLRLDVTFPDCWDGVNLDSPGHRSHLRYSNQGQCLSSHPVPIPQLVFSVAYPVFGDVSHLRLASGSLLTGHADFVNSWHQEKLVNEVEVCLQREKVCGISSGRFTS